MLRFYRTTVLQLMGPGELSSIIGCKPNCWLKIYEIHGRAQGRAKHPERKEEKRSAKTDKQQQATEQRLQASRQNSVEDSGPSGGGSVHIVDEFQKSARGTAPMLPSSEAQARLPPYIILGYVGRFAEGWRRSSGQIRV